MIQSFLTKYLEAKFDEQKDIASKKGKRLVVTVSRDTSCDAFPIVKRVVNKLNRRKSPVGKPIPKWRFLSKEILRQSAEKLKIHHGKLVTLMDTLERGMMDEILMSLSDKNYPNDIKIKNTIREVIQAAAAEGNVILLGRGAVGLTKDIKYSLHIHLTAPLEWRINKEAEEFNQSMESAKRHIKIWDKKRSDLRNSFFGKKVDNSIYDIIFNVSSLKTAEIRDAIYNMIISRGG